MTKRKISELDSVTSPQTVKKVALEPTESSSVEKRHKRAPQHPPIRENDIYVSRRSTFPALCKRALKLWHMEHIRSFTIHGLGAAVPVAVNVALDLQEKTLNQAKWTITTSTVELVDDVEPKDKMEDLKVEKRVNSAIHIHVTK